MAEKKIKFTLRSLSPLLMSWDNLEFADIVREYQRKEAKDGSKATEKGSDRHPAFTWIGRLYHDGKKVAMPTANLMVCLREAATTISVPGAGKKTYKEASQSALLIEEEYLEFVGGTTKAMKAIDYGPIVKLMDVGDDMKHHVDAVKKMGFKIDIRRASPQKGKKHIRCRPRFDNWEVRGEIIITDPDTISLDLLKEIFRIAGTRKGLCDWRPGCPKPGQLGRFVAELTAA